MNGPGDSHLSASICNIIAGGVVGRHSLDSKHAIQYGSLVVVCIAGTACPLEQVSSNFHHVVSGASLLCITTCALL